MDFSRTIALIGGAGLITLPAILWFKRMAIGRRALLSGIFIMFGYFGVFIIIYALDPSSFERIGWLSIAWGGCVLFALAVVAGLGVYWRLKEGRRRWIAGLSKLKGVHPKVLDIYKRFHDIESDGD